MGVVVASTGIKRTLGRRILGINISIDKQDEGGLTPKSDAETTDTRANGSNAAAAATAIIERSDWD